MLPLQRTGWKGTGAPDCAWRGCRRWGEGERRDGSRRGQASRAKRGSPSSSATRPRRAEVGDISSRTEQQPYAARRTRTGGPGMGAPDCAWRGFLCCGRRGGQSKGGRRETRCVGAWADAPDMGLRDLARGGMRRAALEFGRKMPRRHAPRRLRKGALFKIVQGRGIAPAAGLAHFNGLVKGEKYRGGMLRGGCARARYSRSSRVGGLRRLQALPISMAS